MLYVSGCLGLDPKVRFATDWLSGAELALVAQTGNFKSNTDVSVQTQTVRSIAFSTSVDSF